MTVAAKKKPTKARHIYARVRDDGAFVCEDAASRSMLRAKKIRRGQLVRLVVTNQRDYGQWKKAHALGTLITQNLDDFAEFMDDAGKVNSHGALKKLQRMSGVECEDSEIELPGMGRVLLRQPRSLAFDEMEEGEYQAAYAGFCAYLKKMWWHDLSQDEIQEMASLVGDAG